MQIKLTLNRAPFCRLLSSVFIFALVLPWVFPFQLTVNAKKAFAKAANPNLSAPEPFVFNSVSKQQAFVSSLAGNVWTRFVENFKTQVIPDGLGAAKAVSSIEMLPAKITSSWRTATALFGLSASSAPILQQPAGTASFDYDGDGKADLSRWQSATGEWRVKSSLNGTVSNQTLGWSADKIVPADYDADGKTDIASFGASTGAWTIRQSSTGTNISRTLGQTGDVPVSANYGGDSRADIAIFRPSNSTWYYIVTGDPTNTVVSQQWGASGDIAVPGNYDGDSKADFAVFRPSTGYWFVLQSLNGGMMSIQWGLSSDTLVPADYDGDGKTDCAVYRPSNGSWYVYKSSTNNGGYIAQTWGNWGDQPVPADYNNDGRADFAVWRPKTGVWHISQAAAGGGYSYSYQQFGAASDLPTPAAYLKKIGASVAMPWIHKERLSPKNATGGTDLYSQNFSWGASLFGLPGRAGLDAGFGISYNSLVWTRVPTDTETAIIFDPDSSNVTPGFRFGFPTIEQSYPDYRTQRFTYIMTLPSGARVDFRQIAASDTYETGDSSYAQLKVINNSGPNTPVGDLQITVTSADGTQMKYAWVAGRFRGTEIKDRNGNRISINHDSTGLLRTVTDTLGRIITVNYDAELSPISITQTWKSNNGAGANVTHTWATFSYGTTTITTVFDSNLSLYGPASGTVLKVLNRITRADNSYTTFDYNAYGQVWRVNNYAGDNHKLNHIATNLETISGTQTDCPRFKDTKTWAENFNQNQEVVITSLKETITMSGLSEPVTRITVTAPDGITPNGVVVDKSYMLQSAWREGLPFQTETCTSTVCTGTDKKRWTSTVWTQDDNSLTYPVNPRVAESTVSDAANSKKTEFVYEPAVGQPTAANYGRVIEQKIYNNLTNQLLKRSYTKYKDDDAYITRRILGLPYITELYGLDENGVEKLAAKTIYAYDEGVLTDSTLEQSISPIQHDITNYGTSFVQGRGNLTSAVRCDAALSTTGTSCAGGITSSAKYNTAGAVVAQTTPGSDAATTRTVKISYADKFNDGINTRNTYAYPTKVTDPAGKYSEVKYRYDIGANVWAKSPIPNATTPGKETVREFDLIGRLEKEQTVNNNAYTRYQYFQNNIQSKVFSTLVDTNNDGVNAGDEVLVSEVFTDGAGRTRKSRAPMSWDASGAPATYSAQHIEYDVLGRVKRQSAPAETIDQFTANGNWKIPATNEDYRNEDASGNSLLLWTSQSYDWKGRVVQTVNTDGTTTLAEYDGCGCAGGEKVTLKGEEVETGKRRTQKIYSDILGRQEKTEILNWDANNTVYTTTVNTFNERDQVIKIRQYAGNATSQTYQDVINTYDGHGRLKTRHYPIEDANANTTWSYNADDSIASVTDPRGVVTNYSYETARGLLTNISYTVPSSNPAAPDINHIPQAGAVSFQYDDAGNRTAMTDALGTVDYSYDSLSRLTSEKRYFTALPNAPVANNKYSISYGYNLDGSLKSITDPFSSTVNYTPDKLGRLTAVSGTAFGNNTTGNYADQMQYRAFGSLKQMRARTDDNAVVSMQYDERLRVKQHEVQSATHGFVKKAAFSYYADSRPAAMDNQTMDQFDRTFSYDFAGRLTANQIGNAQAATYPYSQTISYDAFSQMTQRSTIHWSANTTFNASFTNGRKQAAGGETPVYDAAGNMLSSGGTVSTSRFQRTSFDAANREASNATRYRAERGRYLFWTIENVTEQIYDGDGHPLKIVQTQQRIDVSSPVETIAQKYQVWSSVLNNTLTEIKGSDGTKERTKIFAGGAVIAEQQKNALGEFVYWKHADPLTGSTTTVEKSGTEAIRTELEALGQEVTPNEPPVEWSSGTPASAFSASEPEWLCRFAGEDYSKMPVSCQRAENESLDYKIIRGESNPQKISSNSRRPTTPPTLKKPTKEESARNKALAAMQKPAGNSEEDEEMPKGPTSYASGGIPDFDDASESGLLQTQQSELPSKKELRDEVERRIKYCTDFLKKLFA